MSKLRKKQDNRKRENKRKIALLKFQTDPQIKDHIKKEWVQFFSKYSPLHFYNALFLLVGAINPKEDQRGHGLNIPITKICFNFFVLSGHFYKWTTKDYLSLEK